MSTSAAILTVERLQASYARRRILDDVTLPAIEAGTLTALIGPNGAGKSTLVKALAQIVPSQGDIAFGGRDLRTLKGGERARVVGFMPQALPAGTELTAIESVVVALRAAARPVDADRRAMDVFRRLDMVDLALRPLDRLSGGERQLVSLAQAIACDPQLLLLDEPTSALDLARQFQVMRHVKALARAGCAVVVVLHDLSLAAQWADRVVVLKAGRFHSAGSPHEAVTPKMLAEVYGLAARIEVSGGQLLIVPEGLAGALSTA